jgi:hypothetical protein
MKPTILFCALFLFASSVASQSINLAVYDQSTNSAEFNLGVRFVPTQLPTHILLVNTATGQTLKIPSTQATVSRTIVSLGSATLGTFFSQPLKTEPVTVFIPFQADPAKPDITILSASVTPLISSIKDLEFQAPKGRDDAELYVSGVAVAGKGSKPVYSADIKLEKLWDLGDSPYRLGFFFSLKASTSKKADPDQFKGGLKVSRNFFIDKGAAKQCDLCFIRWDGTGELEADKEFRVKNLITSQKISFGLRNAFLGKTTGVPVPERTSVRFMPFLGAELGRNLSSPVLRDERGIARVLAGASLELYVPTPAIARYGFAEFSWQNTFTQRWFLKNEMAYDKDDDGNLVLVNFGRKPRSHFTSKLNLMITDFFGPTISYEWGQQPPLYKKIDHTFTIGLTYAIKQKTVK